MATVGSSTPSQTSVPFKTSPPSISPGPIATPGTPGGPGFLLAATEWVAIQIYVANALALPTDDASFRTSLGPGAPASLSDFTPLIACYKAISDHCGTWQRTTYPSTVSLASDVHQYGSQKAPVYYRAIIKEADILTVDPTNADALKALKAILDNLSATATTYQQNAVAVSAQIQTFAEQTQADKVVLVGVDGNSGLTKTYNDKYGAESSEVTMLTAEIAAQRLIMDSANEEYSKDVVVAATTPTYVWIWPFGTIAASVVAGIYGKKAQDALDRAHAARQKIDSDTAQVAADANLMIAIQSAEQGMGKITQALSAALPIIQRIQGVWGGIASDIGAIVTLIDTDIRKALPILMNLGVEEAIQSWANVASEANSYRVNAYITLTGAPPGVTIN